MAGYTCPSFSWHSPRSRCSVGSLSVSRAASNTSRAPAQSPLRIRARAASGSPALPSCCRWRFRGWDLYLGAGFDGAGWAFAGPDVAAAMIPPAAIATSLMTSADALRMRESVEHAARKGRISGQAGLYLLRGRCRLGLGQLHGHSRSRRQRLHAAVHHDGERPWPRVPRRRSGAPDGPHDPPEAGCLVEVALPEDGRPGDAAVVLHRVE